MNAVYSFMNVIVLPFWLLIIFAPGAALTRRLMRSIWPVTFLPILYVGLLISLSGGVPALPLDFSLQGIANLLGTREGAAIAWAHFLAFDLFVGRWIYLDSLPHGLPVWLVSISLFLCFMAGPFGLLIYLILRWINERKVSPK